MQNLVKKVAKSRSAADVVHSMDDLLIQILSRLPLKLLMRFKLVSKHWKSLITSHHFSLVLYRGPNPVLGLFIQDHMSSYNYIPLDATNLTTEPPIRALSFPGDHSPYLIIQSCNGLLLCSGFDESNCYVYNPTTKCSARLPGPNRIVLGLSLAFDPANSPVYKVVRVRSSGHSYLPFQIEIYSSESRAWRVSGEPFGVRAWFHHGVYWNGSVHWINYQENGILYFDLNKEEIKGTPLPDGMARAMYFGESRDHLHVIGLCDAQMGFNVYEMRRDYKEWFVVYRVDMTMAAEYFPNTTNVDYRMMCDGASELENRVGNHYIVLSLVRADEKRPFLVLHAPDKALRCNLHDNTFEVIPDIGAAVVESWLQYGFKRYGIAGIVLPYAFELVESLAGV